MKKSRERIYADRMARAIREVVKKWERGDLAAAVNTARTVAEEYAEYRAEQARIMEVLGE